MMKNFLRVLIPVFMVAMLMTSCDKDSEVDTITEDYIDMEITDRDGGVFGAPYGKNRCFQILFPYTVQFSDSTQVTAENREELHQAIVEWKQQNPDSRVRPKPVFPFTVKFRDGTTMEVTGVEDLESIRSTCRELLQDRPIHPRPHRTCFKIVYPITIDFPGDLADLVVNSAEEFRAALRDWRLNNEGSMDRPEIIYPINVKMKRSGEIITLQNVEALKALHRSCR
jgi:hypothetical protein